MYLGCDFCRSGKTSLMCFSYVYSCTLAEACLVCSFVATFSQAESCIVFCETMIAYVVVFLVVAAKVFVDKAPITRANNVVKTLFILNSYHSNC